MSVVVVDHAESGDGPDEGVVVGFCVVLAPGSSYDSVNYLWFMDRYDDAYYLDRVAFVVKTGKLKVGTPGRDKATLSMLLYDPSFFFDPVLAPDLEVRILDGTTVVFERDFASLASFSIGTDKRTGEPVWTLKSGKDDVENDRIRKFSFRSAKGALTLSLSDADLSGVPAGEAHLGVEVSIGNRVYFTTVTFFEGRTGRYSTTY